VPRGTTFRRDSHGENPALFKMNQKGTMMIAKPINMKIGMMAIKAIAMR
jgi:hypothetical protein